MAASGVPKEAETLTGSRMPPEFATGPSDLEPTVLDTEPVDNPALEFSDAPFAARKRLHCLRLCRFRAPSGISRSTFCGVCPAGHSGDEHRQFWVAMAGVWQPDARRRVCGARSRHLVLQSSCLRRKDDDDFLDAVRSGPGFDGPAGRSAGRGLRASIIAGCSGCWRSGWFTRT